ncbi:MAG: ABC transporter ATP-binding protein [Oscillospiraceae bacterium]|nr:ABC transporter ATP-binding protein [Oscillospiraceae bacterium]
MSAEDNLIVCSGLTKTYGGKIALNNVSLNIGRGKIIGLLGPNGSGKTTLIKLLCGILTPTCGEITISGKAVGIETKKIVAYLPERTYLSEWMSVREMITFFSDFYEDFNAVNAYDMLARLNIDPQAKLKSMSKGTREKVQLILVMCRNAELYLLDEPIGGVDPAARDYIIQTILKNYNENASVIISTHLISDVEHVLDEVVFIKNGSVVMQSEVDEIREQYGKSVDGVFREVFAC